jgi:hypothetical protein
MPRARFVHERSRASLLNEMTGERAREPERFADATRRRMAEVDRFLDQPA